MFWNLFKKYWEKQKSMAINEVWNEERHGFALFKIKQQKQREKIEEVIRPLLAEMEERVNLLQSMQKLEVKDGDIVVLRYPSRLSKTASDHLRTNIQEIIKEAGFNVRVMVFEEGMEIGVLTKEEGIKVYCDICKKEVPLD